MLKKYDDIDIIVVAMISSAASLLLVVIYLCFTLL